MKNNVKWELNPEIVARHFLKNVSVPMYCATEGGSYLPAFGTGVHPAGVRESVLGWFAGVWEG